MQLQQRFTPWHLLFLSINGMLGSAWLFAPLYAARLAGDGVVIAWVLGGLATIAIALTFAEISTLLPIAGGSARFAELCHGGLTGFIISWITWLSCVTMAPIEVQAVLQYASTYFTSLMHVVNGGAPQLTSIGLVWACIVLLGLSIINVASFRGLIGFNLVLFVFKVAVVAIVISLFIHTRFVPANFTLPTESQSYWHGVLAAIATGGIAFAFTGFKHGVELAQESHRPKFSIPLAIIGSVTICLIIYLGLQIAFVGALSPDNLKHGWAGLVFEGDLGPFVGLAGALGLFLLVKLLYVDAAVSPLGAGLIYVTSTARIIYGMSRLGFLPKLFSNVNKEKMPMNAIWLNFLVGLFLFLPLPGWQNMVSFLVSAVVISYAMGPIVLIALRCDLPKVVRPFRLPLALPLCFLAFYFCNLMSYWTGWSTLSKLAIAVFVGFVVLLIAIIRGSVDAATLKPKALAWILPYLAGLIILSYCGSFGGKNWIPFGWDFLVIALFSVVIFYLAIKFRQDKLAALFKDCQDELQRSRDEIEQLADLP